MKPYKPLHLAALAALLAATASAAPTAPVRPDPSDARAEAPPTVYQSALRGYRPYADTEPAPWVEANERVGRIGGWRVYAKEAREPQPPASGASAPAHDGHHQH